MEDIIAQITAMPVGKSDMRALSALMTSDEVKAAMEAIIKKYYTSGDVDAKVKSLAQKLVEELDIDPVYAAKVQKDIEAKIREKAEAKLNASPKRVKDLMQAISNGKKAIRLAVAESIVKGQMRGEMEDAILAQMGFSGMTKKDVDTAKGLLDRLALLEPDEELHRELTRYLNDIFAKYDQTTAALAHQSFMEAIYTNVLSGIMTTALRISTFGMLASSLAINSTAFVTNPNRYIRGVKNALAMREAGATPGRETVKAKWADADIDLGESTQYDKPNVSRHSNLSRAREMSYADIVRAYKTAPKGRKGYFAALALIKTQNQMMNFGLARTGRRKPTPIQWAINIMASQDILAGPMFEDIAASIESEKYIDFINAERKKEGLPPIKKFSGEWNDIMKQMLSSDPETVKKLQQEVANEAIERRSRGEVLPQGWERRRLRGKIKEALDGEVKFRSEQFSKNSLFLGKPQTALGAYIYSALNWGSKVNDKDGLIKSFLKTAIGSSMMFGRLVVTSGEKTLPSLMLRGAYALFSDVGYRTNNRGQVETYKMSNEERAQKVGLALYWTALSAALVTAMFDFDTEEGDDGEEKKVIKLNPNFPIQFFGPGKNQEERNKMEMHGGRPNTIKIGNSLFDINLMQPEIQTLAAILGTLSDDARMNEGDFSSDEVAKVVALQSISGDFNPFVKTSEDLFYGKPLVEIAVDKVTRPIEASLSPVLYNNAVRDTRAYFKGVKEKRVTWADQVLEDIWWTNLMNDTGKPMTNHFGQPIYITPTNSVITALRDFDAVKHATSQVKDNPLYSVTEGKFQPKPYDDYSAKGWLRDGYKPKPKVREFLTEQIKAETGALMAKYLERIQAKSTIDKRLEYIEKAEFDGKVGLKTSAIHKVQTRYKRGEYDEIIKTLKD